MYRPAPFPRALVAPLLASLLLTSGCSGCRTGSDTDETPGSGAATAGPPVAQDAGPAESIDSRQAANPARGLRARIDLSRQRVEGRFHQVAFEAERVEGGRARARYWVDGQDASVGVAIEGPERGSIEWRGKTLDGYGPLTDSERETLAQLEQHLPARTLALVPLDLACAPGADKLDPAIAAALLMPFQMRLKYRTPASDVEQTIVRTARHSRCQYFVSPLDERDPARTPSPMVAALSFEQPVPMVYGFFPFDGEGQAE